MRSRYGTEGKKYVCLWLPDAFASEQGQGIHIPSPGGSLHKEESLCMSGSAVL
jgi:hypothetical protein